MTDPATVDKLRGQVFGAIVMICVQAGLGMFVNLFVSIPVRHAGSMPSEFFSGSARSALWAIGHGAVALSIHVGLGLLLALLVIGIVARALSIGRTSVTIWVVLGALGTIGAGFTGAGFLDFNQDVSSFFMATLALGALLCFVVVIFLPWDVASTVAPTSSRRSELD